MLVPATVTATAARYPQESAAAAIMIGTLASVISSRRRISYACVGSAQDRSRVIADQKCDLNYYDFSESH